MNRGLSYLLSNKISLRRLIFAEINLREVNFHGFHVILANPQKFSVKSMFFPYQRKLIHVNFFSKLLMSVTSLLNKIWIRVNNRIDNNSGYMYYIFVVWKIKRPIWLIDLFFFFLLKKAWTYIWQPWKEIHSKLLEFRDPRKNSTQKMSNLHPRKKIRVKINLVRINLLKVVVTSVEQRDK